MSGRAGRRSSLAGEHSRPAAMCHPDQCLAVLRIAIGVYFLKALWTKLHFVLLGGVVPMLQVDDRWLGVMPKIVARQAAENPFPWYKSFLEQTVLANGSTFAQLTAWGEALVGVSLTVGVLTGVGALGALLLLVSYALAAQHLSPASFGLHYVFIVSVTLLYVARAGRVFGLDARIANRWPASWPTRRPWS
jgi:uncharacterized membrane protein YphA (DoxX/SURF4 family)